MKYLLVALVLTLTACSSDPASPDNGKPSTQMVLNGDWSVEGIVVRLEERKDTFYVSPRLTVLEFYAGEPMTWTGDSAFYVVSNPELFAGDTARFQFIRQDSMTFTSKAFGTQWLSRRGL